MSENLGVSEAVRRPNNRSCRATCARPLRHPVALGLPWRSCRGASGRRIFMLTLFLIVLFIWESNYIFIIIIYLHVFILIGFVYICFIYVDYIFIIIIFLVSFLLIGFVYLLYFPFSYFFSDLTDTICNDRI